MDITHFCAEGDGRYPLAAPFVWYGRKYATDGCIAIRQDTADLASEGKYGRKNLAEVAKQIAARFENHMGGQEFAQLPEVPQHAGGGKDCQEPACQFGPGGERACAKFDTCEATGDHECTNMTKYRVLDPQEFAGHKWGGRYIQIINDELPGARYHVTNEGVMQFVCDNVEGVLGHTKG